MIQRTPSSTFGRLGLRRSGSSFLTGSGELLALHSALMQLSGTNPQALLLLDEVAHIPTEPVSTQTDSQNASNTNADGQPSSSGSSSNSGYQIKNRVTALGQMVAEAPNVIRACTPQQILQIMAQVFPRFYVKCT